MKRFRIICVIAFLSIGGLYPLRAQDNWQLVGRIERAVKKAGGKWSSIRGVCTCPPLIPNQKSLAISEWFGAFRGGKPSRITMEIYEVASVEDAVRWMSRFGRGETPYGGRTTPYELGDEAYLSRTHGGEYSYLRMRRGTTVVVVRGELKEDVEQFARYALSQLAAS